MDNTLTAQFVGFSIPSATFENGKIIDSAPRNTSCILIRCPYCGQPGAGPLNAVGREEACRYCHQTYHLPTRPRDELIYESLMAVLYSACEIETFYKRWIPESLPTFSREELRQVSETVRILRDEVHRVLQMIGPDGQHTLIMALETLTRRRNGLKLTYIGGLQSEIEDHGPLNWDAPLHEIRQATISLGRSLDAGDPSRLSGVPASSSAKVDSNDTNDLQETTSPKSNVTTAGLYEVGQATEILVEFLRKTGRPIPDSLSAAQGISPLSAEGSADVDVGNKVVPEGLSEKDQSESTGGNSKKRTKRPNGEIDKLVSSFLACHKKDPSIPQRMSAREIVEQILVKYQEKVSVKSLESNSVYKTFRTTYPIIKTAKREMPEESLDELIADQGNDELVDKIRGIRGRKTKSL